MLYLLHFIPIIKLSPSSPLQCMQTGHANWVSGSWDNTFFVNLICFFVIMLLWHGMVWYVVWCVCTFVLCALMWLCLFLIIFPLFIWTLRGFSVSFHLYRPPSASSESTKCILLFIVFISHFILCTDSTCNRCSGCGLQP